MLLTILNLQVHRKFSERVLRRQHGKPKAYVGLSRILLRKDGRVASMKARKLTCGLVVGSNINTIPVCGLLTGSVFRNHIVYNALQVHPLARVEIK